MKKLITAAQAARLIRDEAVVTISSSSGLGCPDSVLAAIRERFDQEGAPRNITTLNPIAAGDMYGIRGIDPTLNETVRVYGVRGLTRLRLVTLPAAAPQIFSASTVVPTPRRPAVYKLSFTATSSLMTTVSTWRPRAWQSSAAISKFMTSPV